jgi:hypothetical protein
LILTLLSSTICGKLYVVYIFLAQFFLVIFVVCELYRHNAQVYEAKGKVSLICSDVYKLLDTLVELRKLPGADPGDGGGNGDSEAATVTSSSSCSTSSSCSQPAATASSAATSFCNETQQGTSSATLTSPCPDILDILAPEHLPHLEALFRQLPPDLVILSPPWGGPEYVHVEPYCLYTMLSCGSCWELVLGAVALGAPSLLLLIPVNSSVAQVAEMAAAVGMPYVIEYVSINQCPKVMAVYMGLVATHVQHQNGVAAAAAAAAPQQTKQTKQTKRKQQSRGKQRKQGLPVACVADSAADETGNQPAEYAIDQVESHKDAEESISGPPVKRTHMRFE